MAIAKVDFQIESTDNPGVTADVRQPFIDVTDVTSWQLVEANGNVLYKGLIVMGPKPLPQGNSNLLRSSF